MNHASPIAVALTFLAAIACGTSAETAPAGTAEGLRTMMRQFIKADGDRTLALGKELRPQAADYALVFGPETGKRIEAAFAPAWDKGAVIHPVMASLSNIAIHSATGKELRDKTGDARTFPEGYRRIAGTLNPDLRYWLVHFYGSDRDRGIRFDLLVFVNGAWRAFPEPWRLFK